MPMSTSVTTVPASVIRRTRVKIVGLQGGYYYLDCLACEREIPEAPVELLSTLHSAALAQCPRHP
jgi:hypothetical protein